MHMTVSFLTLLSRLSYQINNLRTCAPNTQFVLNGRLCFCNNFGIWNDAGCKLIERRHLCQIGQIVREGCNQCICQQNGRFLCTNVYCPINNELSTYDAKCIPYRSYYVNCNLCTCPASGLSSEAHCSKDISCQIDTNSLDFELIKNIYCIPNVMYIFTCIHCVCSDNGFFVFDKCVEKCETAVQVSNKCIPGKYYRKDCDVCLCPDNNKTDEMICTKVACKKDVNKPIYLKLKNTSIQCNPLTFIKPRCLFCDCSVEGTINDDKCTEVDCSKASNMQKIYNNTFCSPGEVVPTCIECFCPKSGLTNANYCTNGCSYQNKLDLLEKLFNETFVHVGALRIQDEEICDPSTLYLDDGRYCLCPESGYKDIKYCTSSKIILKAQAGRKEELIYNITECEPGTYMEFDCNTCYCPKNGKINPKWCTYDDCSAKESIKAAHKSHFLPIIRVNSDGTCTPGTISNVKCNFCICPESGLLKERACTKNNCDDEENQTIGMNKFTCEPLSYYEVDCNVCFCPREGIKNVAKCTKNHCEKTFLRSSECVPGHLFIEACNVCVCPPNGDRINRACTEHRCDVNPWNLLKLSQNPLENNVKIKKIRTIDHCFPGEEFVDGCKICVCPEMGLRLYASCESIACSVEENHTIVDVPDKLSVTDTEISDINADNHNRVRRFGPGQCMDYKVHAAAERFRCTPGSTYIVRCQQCICPYMGNINQYCRPLPSSTYCEQAYPGYNFLPMGRKFDTSNKTSFTNDTMFLEANLKYTKYKCDKEGKIMDDCFICTCEDGNVIEEHCFKSDSEKCKESKPLFLNIFYVSSVKACKPNSYVVIGCNVCRCDDTGKVSKEYCTKKTCPSTSMYRKTRRSYNVDGSCDPGNWYSAEPCQFCFCLLKNKLICNSISNHNKLKLGKFDFVICGSNYLQEASQLTSDTKDLRYNKRKKKAEFKHNLKRKIKKTTDPESVNTDELFQDLLHSKRHFVNNDLGNDEFNENKDNLDPEFPRMIGQTVFPDNYDNEPLSNEKESDQVSKDGSQKTKGQIDFKEDDIRTQALHLGIDLPSIESDVLSMGRRNSMISIVHNDDCTPGTTFTRSNDCEKCFCLKNGKMLCTQLCKNKP